MHCFRVCRLGSVLIFGIACSLLLHGMVAAHEQISSRQSQILHKRTAQFQGCNRIISSFSRKALEVNGDSKANGGRVDQWDYVNQSNEQWELISTGDGYYTIKSCSSGKVLEVNGDSQANGGRVDQWEDLGQTNEQWRVTLHGDGYYTIMGRSSQKVLEVNGNSRANGGTVDQWTDLGQTNERWSITPA